MISWLMVNYAYIVREIMSSLRKETVKRVLGGIISEKNRQQKESVQRKYLYLEEKLRQINFDV